MAHEKFAHCMFSTMSKDHLSHSQNTTIFQVPYDLRCWILEDKHVFESCDITLFHSNENFCLSIWI